MMKKSIIYKMTFAAVFATAAMLTGCSDDTLPQSISPAFNDDVCRAENVHRTGATLFGNVAFAQGTGYEEYGILLSEYPSMAEARHLVESSGSKSYSMNVEGLKPSTTYFFCSYAKSGTTTVMGGIRNFSTLSTGGPTFQNTRVADVTSTGCQVSTEIFDNGGTDLLMSGFIYKEVADDKAEENREFTINDEGVMALASEVAGEMLMHIPNLQPGKLYAVRPYGVSYGVGYGDAMYFVTEQTNVPALSTTTIGNIEASAFNVSADIIADGTSSVIERGFCYSPDTKEPTVQNAHKTVPLNGPFETTLTDLNPGLTYYVRSYARNNSGVGYGDVIEINIDKEINVVYEEVHDTTIVDRYPDFSVIRPLPIEVGETTYSDITNNGFTAHSSIDFAHYINMYNEKYGYNDVYGNSYYANLFPVMMTGFVYSSTSQEPTVENCNKMIVSQQPFNPNDGKFSAVIPFNVSVTKYYVRAFAVNSYGTTYSETVIVEAGPNAGDNFFPDVP